MLIRKNTVYLKNIVLFKVLDQNNDSVNEKVGIFWVPYFLENLEISWPYTLTVLIHT